MQTRQTELSSELPMQKSENHSTESQMNTLKLGEPEKTRWYILIVYSMISALQCNAWFTFSSVPDEVQQYYDLKPANDKVNSTIDILLNYGPIMFIFTTPFAAYVLLYPKQGLRHTTILAANLILFGSLLRCLPSILNDIDSIPYKITNSFWNTLIFIHIGQILVNIAGPLVMSAPSKLSVIWFPDYQRKTATAIAAISNSIGQCFGFIIAPLIVNNNSDNFKYVLYLDLVLITIVWLLVLAYFPSSPNKLPSIAAKAAFLSVPIDEMHKFFGNEMTLTRSGSMAVSLWDATESIKSSTCASIEHNTELLGQLQFRQSDVSHIVNNIRYTYHRFTLKKHLENLVSEIKWMLLSISTVFIAIIGGMEIGAFAAWSAMLQDTIGEESILHLSDRDVGIIGFIGTLTYIFGGIIVGPISDKWFAKRLKALLFGICIALVFCVCCLLLFVPSPLLKCVDSKQNVWIIGILNGVCGLFAGCSLPIFYELCVEVSYPVSEGSSATFLMFIENISLLVFVGIVNWISTQWIVVLLLSVCILCVILLIFVKERYKRL